MIRRHRRPTQDSDLDITAFMNLMIVLVPILLINMIFAHTSVIELNFPESETESALDPDRFDLRVAIYSDSIDVQDGNAFLIKRIDNSKDGFDKSALLETMKEIKRRVPDERSITILAEKNTSYQSLVSVMDSVSSFDTLAAGSLVKAELFPDIAIADAPPEKLPPAASAP